MIISNWYNSYTENWKNKLEKDNSNYDFKISYSLLRRLGQHFIDSHYLNKGDIICDPIAGIGTTVIALADKFHVLCVCQEQDYFFSAKKNIAYNKWIENNTKNNLSYTPHIIHASDYRFQDVLIRNKIKTDIISAFIFSIPWHSYDSLKYYTERNLIRLTEMYYSCKQNSIMAIVTNRINSFGTIIDVPEIIRNIVSNTRWVLIEEIHSFAEKEAGYSMDMFGGPPSNIGVTEKNIILIYKKIK